MRVLRLVVGSTLAFAVACGQTPTRVGDGTDGGTGELDAGVPEYPAAFPDPPSVVTYGGPVLKDPRFVPVFFSNDNAELVGKLTTFLNDIGATDYWHQVTSEYCYWATSDHTVDPQYCIGAGHATASVTVDAAELTAMKSTDGTISDDSIKNWLKAKLDSNNAAFPTPDQNSIYVLHFPQNIVITLAGGFGGSSQSCQEFGGYHSDLTVAGHLNNKVAYAVIPRCAAFGSLLGIDAVTGAESHELIEASSDPYPNLMPAYASVDTGHEYMAFLVGGTENGDMCAQDPEAFTQFDEIPFYVQRSWSNIAAKAGHDPCVPALPGQVYFNAGPVLTDIVNINNMFGRAQFIGVNVPVGQTETVTLQLYSDGPTNGPWSVSVKDSGELTGGRTELTLSLDKTSGQNGDIIQLTITPKRASQYGVSLFRVRSTMGGVSHDWWGAVGNAN